jgi:hypothetical protein
MWWSCASPCRAPSLPWLGPGDAAKDLLRRADRWDLGKSMGRCLVEATEVAEACARQTSSHRAVSGEPAPTMPAPRGQASLCVGEPDAGNSAPQEAAQLFLVTPELLILSTPETAEAELPFHSDALAEVAARCLLLLHPGLSSR